MFSTERQRKRWKNPTKICQRFLLLLSLLVIWLTQFLFAFDFNFFVHNYQAVWLHTLYRFTYRIVCATKNETETIVFVCQIEWNKIKEFVDFDTWHVATIILILCIKSQNWIVAIGYKNAKRIKRIAVFSRFNTQNARSENLRFKWIPFGNVPDFEFRENLVVTYVSRHRLFQIARAACLRLRPMWLYLVSWHMQ